MANLEEDAMFVPTFTQREYEDRLATLLQKIRSECALLIQQPCNDDRVIELLLCVTRLSQQGKLLKTDPVSYVENETLFAILEDIRQKVVSLHKDEVSLEPMSLQDYLRDKGHSASSANVSMLYEKLMTLDLQPISKKGKQKEWTWQTIALDNAWAEVMNSVG